MVAPQSVRQQLQATLVPLVHVESLYVLPVVVLLCIYVNIAMQYYTNTLNTTASAGMTSNATAHDHIHMNMLINPSLTDGMTPKLFGQFLPRSADLAE